MNDIDEAVYDSIERRNDPNPDPTRDMPEPEDVRETTRQWQEFADRAEIAFGNRPPDPDPAILATMALIEDEPDWEDLLWDEADRAYHESVDRLSCYREPSTAGEW